MNYDITKDHKNYKAHNDHFLRNLIYVVLAILLLSFIIHRGLQGLKYTPQEYCDFHYGAGTCDTNGEVKPSETMRVLKGDI